MPRLLEPDPDHAGVGKYIKSHLYFSFPFSIAYPCRKRFHLFKTPIWIKFSTTFLFCPGKPGSLGQDSLLNYEK